MFRQVALDCSTIHTCWTVEQSKPTYGHDGMYMRADYNIVNDVQQSK